MTPTPPTPADDVRAGWRPLIWAVVGFVVGVAVLDGGYLIGAVAGWAVGLALAHQSSLRRLQARIQQLEQQASVAAAAAAPADLPVVIAAPVAAPAPPVAVLVESPIAEARPAEAMPAAAEPAAAWTPPPPAPPTAFDRAMADAWGWLRGGNPLAKVGVVILFFGAVFLVRYAAEQRMFPIELRFAGLAAGAIALLVMGWRLRLTRPAYAQVLQGGGVAGLYLVTFAAARLYQLLPLELALAVMVAVAVLAGLLAVAQNSLVMAVIGTGGGFLAPLLVSTGSGNYIALFSYYAVLNLGVFTVAWFRAWRLLNLLGLFFTFGIVGLFRGTGYDASERIGTDAFVILFFLMYVAVSILFALRQKPDLRGYVSASLVFGLPVAAFGIHCSLWAGTEYALSLSALAFGAFYLLLASVLWNRQREQLRLLCEAFAALGVVFTSLAIPLAFDEQATAAMWAAEGAGLMWLGVRQDRKLARAFSALLQVGALLSLLSELPAPASALPVVNGQCLGLLILGASALLSGHWLRRPGETIPGWEQGWSLMAIAIGTVLVVSAGFAEIVRVLESVRVGALLAWFALVALVWQSLARRLAWPLWDHLGVAVMGLAAWVAIQQLFGPVHVIDEGMNVGASALVHPSLLTGWAGWPLWFVAQYRLLWRREPDAPLLAVQHVATALLAVFLLVWEATAQVSMALPQGFWRWLPSAALFAFALTLMTRAVLLPAWPLARYPQAFRRGVGWPMAIAALFWLLAANLGSTGNAAPLATWPLVNPLDLASIGLLLALARFGLLKESRAGLQIGPRELVAVLAGLVFFWLNAALVRGLHYGLGTPLFGQGALQSTFLQATLSVFWSLIAFGLMLFASRHRQRLVWLAGAALMAVVVVKLFLVDTAARGTLARIVAFFAVGGVLLVTGYFSPLPPATPKPGDTPAPTPETP